MNDTSLFLTLSGAAAVLVSAYIVSNPFAVPSRANEQAFYWFSLGLSAVAFFWVALDASGLLPPNTTSSFHFQLPAIRRYLEEKGFVIDDVVERGPYAPEVEYQSQRAYIFARKPG